MKAIAAIQRAESKLLNYLSRGPWHAKCSAVFTHFVLIQIGEQNSVAQFGFDKKFFFGRLKIRV